MPFFDGFELLKCAIEQEREEKIFLRWVVGYQSTTTYEEFKNTLMQKSISDDRTSEEILEDVSKLIGRFGV